MKDKRFKKNEVGKLGGHLSPLPPIRNASAGYVFFFLLWLWVKNIYFHRIQTDDLMLSSRRSSVTSMASQTNVEDVLAREEEAKREEYYETPREQQQPQYDREVIHDSDHEEDNKSRRYKIGIK